MVILESNQIQAWDAFTMASRNIRSFDLMQQAAQACVNWLELNTSNYHHYYVFCGKGNNGGDGLSIANRLSALGFSVDVFILEYGKIGSPDFQEALQHAHDGAFQLHYISSKDSIPVIPNDVCVIDALFGIGFNRPLDDLASYIVQVINASKAFVVSIDVPSGLYADTTNHSNLSVKAHYTLSFSCYKLAFLHFSAERSIGNVVILDIGLDARFLDTIIVKFRLIDLLFVKDIYKPRSLFSHKGHFGHALLVAGSETMPGAGVIAANLCVRTGAGKTDWYCPLMKHLPANLLSEIMLPKEVFHEVEKYSSIAFGPGFGRSSESKELVHQILQYRWKSMVVDADALNIISEQPELLEKFGGETILTPHPKEFDRLVAALKIEGATPWQQLQNMAQITSCVVVLKGRYTMIASPEGIIYINTTGNPGLAKGGSGDALTGILLGLTSQPFYQTLEAAILGVFLHGKAADLGLKTQSVESLIASDLADYMGQAFKELV